MTWMDGDPLVVGWVSRNVGGRLHYGYTGLLGLGFKSIRYPSICGKNKDIEESAKIMVRT